MLLDQKRCGLLMRVFAKAPEQVAKNASQVIAAAEKASALHIGGKPVFAKILVLVAADDRYPDCDCGQTAAYLRERLPPRSEVLEVRRGDIFCGVLNYGIARLLRDRIDYVTILSHGAAGYLTERFAGQTFEALEKGAAVVGAAIDELSPSILEGRVANTLATWDAVKLVSVGGFDLRAGQPARDDRTAPYLRGWNGASEVFYALAGVEEIIPLIRLGVTYGCCIAPIRPENAAEWKVPDPATDAEGFQRHLKKMGTKFERQAAHAASERSDLSAIRGFVMPEYRTF